MRKQTKKKKKSCALCKPWKMNGQNRWKHKEKEELKQIEKLKRLY